MCRARLCLPYPTRLVSNFTSPEKKREEFFECVMLLRLRARVHVRARAARQSFEDSPPPPTVDRGYRNPDHKSTSANRAPTPPRDRTDDDFLCSLDFTSSKRERSINETAHRSGPEAPNKNSNKYGTTHPDLSATYRCAPWFYYYPPTGREGDSGFISSLGR